MKKTLRISLVALFAAVPMMAMAAVGDVVGTGDTPKTPATQPTGTALTAVKAAGQPYFELAKEAASDVNAASAGYVKGAYNAAIKAVNTVHAEVVAAQSTANNAVKGVKVNGDELSKDADGKVDVTITEGATNGTIKVNNKAVSVHGLGTAAYSAATAFDASGAATSAKSAIESKLSSGLSGYDINAKSVSVQGKAVLTTDSALDGKKLTSGTVVETALASDVQESLDLAKSAVQSVATGGVNGSISVDGTNVAVKGLGGAAYKGVATDINSTSTDLATGSAVWNAVKGKAEKATTLAGYGITDAYTSAAADSKFATQTGVAATVNAAKITIMKQWGSDSATVLGSVSVDSYKAQ